MHEETAIEISIDEDARDTVVRAVLTLGGDRFEAIGRARRNPQDTPMPVVGEELATARALSSLALQVMEAAQHKIERFLSG